MSDMHCQHNYCPHLHFKKCRRQRERHIPYKNKPQRKIQLSFNVHPKMLDLSIRNIPTLAYESYAVKMAIPDQDEANFSKNYYLENCPDNFQLRNTLVQDKQNQLLDESAYVLAIDATKQYNKFAKQKQDYLTNAQKRAKISYHNYFQNKKEQMIKLKEEQSKWVIDYCRKVQELINHMFGKQNNQNVDPNIQDKLFIKENESKTVKYLNGFKVSDPKAALQILTSLRALLLRKKISLQEQRKNQDHNKSASASCIDNSASQSQDVTQGTSFLSAATDITKSPGEEHFAEQFCDFQALEKKWGLKNVEQIRKLIRRLLAKTMVCNAQGHQMREKRAAKQKNELLKRQMKEMGKLQPSKDRKDVTQSKQKASSTKTKAKQTASIPEITQQLHPTFKETLTTQEFQVKSRIMKGGQFDSVGNKYQRNRNYSLLFQKKQLESQLELSFREQKQKLFFRSETARK